MNNTSSKQSRRSSNVVTKIVMPRLSLTMKQGMVGKWYKQEGQTVEKGEPIAEVVSEKATYDLEAPASGLLRRILVQEGVDTPVNAVLAVITAPDEAFSETETISETPEPIESEGEKRVLASPAAKRLAREYGINLSTIVGSGPDGRIVERDVERFIEEKDETAPKVKEIVPLSGFRRTSAERLSMSFKTAPHSTIMMDVEVAKVAELHEKAQVSFTTLIVKAVSKALAELPQINSRLEKDEIKMFEDVNVGVAVATKNGLLVPVIRNSDKKSLEEIEAAIKQLSEKAKQGKLSRQEVTGGTFTITNLGMYGVDFFTPIINPPESAILGVGRVADKPVIIGGRIEVKPIMTLSLSYDHRTIDGAPAAEFLRNVKEKIEKLDFNH
jgi:pyruvate dehydrogenase E2 component (dihydrolipoamide acetyltransferase)